MEVPPCSARALPLLAGQRLRITDLLGGQPGDLLVFAADDTRTSMSQSRTRVENAAVRITSGAALWSNTDPPDVLMRIVEDSFGQHDLLYAPCCRFALRKRFGVDRTGCWEHLAEALKPWGVDPRHCQEPLSLFFCSRVESNGSLHLAKHTSAPGDRVAFSAMVDCLVGVSTCSVPRNDGPNGPYRLDVLADS